MSSGSRRLEDLRREATAAARGLQGGEHALIGALEAFQAESERFAETYHAMVRSLALALEARDGYTGEHSDEVERLSVAVAGRLGLDRAQVADVQSTALLHDIGKIGIPDRVLHKPGRLDEDEWALMHEHPVIGERILRPPPGFGSVATAVRHEHERCAGTQFAPRVVGALLACLDAPLAPEAPEPAPTLPGAEADDALQRLSRELRVLMSLSSAVAATNSLMDLLDLAAEEACAALGASSVSVSRWEAQAEVLRTVVNAGELAPGE